MGFVFSRAALDCDIVGFPQGFRNKVCQEQGWFKILEESRQSEGWSKSLITNICQAGAWEDSKSSFQHLIFRSIFNTTMVVRAESAFD